MERQTDEHPDGRRYKIYYFPAALIYVVGNQEFLAIPHIEKR